MMSRKLERDPLYVKLAAALRDEIRQNFHSGMVLPAESRLAKQYGVSVMTLREALSALAQEGLIERVHGKGNFVRDQALHRHVAILNELDLSSPRVSGFFMHCIRKIAGILDGEEIPFRFYFGYTPAGSVPPSRPTCPAFWEAFESGSLNGVIAITSWLNPEWTKQLDERKVPIVGNQAVPYPQVVINYDDLLCQGMEYLLNLGCRSIAVFRYGESHEATTISVDQERFLQRNHQYSPWIHGIYTCSLTEKGHLPETVFSTAWNDSGQPPDGLIVLDDMVFLEIMNAASRMQIAVPDALKIVTHQNGGLSNFNFFPVTCLVIDPDEYAEKLAGLMIEQLRNPDRIPSSQEVRAVLVEQDAWVRHPVRAELFTSKMRAGS